MNAFERVKMLVGEDALNTLKNSSVAVFGIGGVGGYAAEALVRSGVGKIALFDSDTVDISNINRQVIANTKTVGKDKVSVMKERLTDINPSVEVKGNKVFYLPENADDFDFSEYDYVIDAVDTVSAKIEIIKRAVLLGVPVISCMGTGGKLFPERLKVSRIEETKVCPLARVMRRELKNRNISGVKVVWSDEEGVQGIDDQGAKKADGKTAPPSMIFVPATAGLLLAREVVLDLTKGK
jgi:tRNA A37 threonylcarbamoyladenosine dehydratase